MENEEIKKDSAKERLAKNKEKLKKIEQEWNAVMNSTTDPIIREIATERMRAKTIGVLADGIITAIIPDSMMTPIPSLFQEAGKNHPKEKEGSE